MLTTTFGMTPRAKAKRWQIPKCPHCAPSFNYSILKKQPEPTKKAMAVRVVMVVGVVVAVVVVMMVEVVGDGGGGDGGGTAAGPELSR